MDETLAPASVSSAQAATMGPKPQRRSAKKKQTKQKQKPASRTGAARRGWGPYKSVSRERSVDFNLTLDVQSLQQEIRNMETLRALLEAKTLVQRHSVDGSLVHTAREFYRVFRTGFAVPGARRPSIPEQQQRDFLFTTMDEHVDVGNDLYGPEVMAQQLQIYSTFVRYLNLSFESVDVISADESVVVATRGAFRFQVLRNTIQQIFPHVMANEALVARLVGRQVDVLTKLTFFFNAAGTCVKYQVDIDFLAAFGTIVTDPLDLDLLFGRALIADNCMLGLIETPVETLEENRPGIVAITEPPPLAPRLPDPLDSSNRSSRGDGHCEAEGTTHAQQVDRAHLVVSVYYSVFASAFAAAPNFNAFEAEGRIVARYCEPSVCFGHADRTVGIRERWSDLREAFDIFVYQLDRMGSACYDACLGAYRVDTVGVYELRTTLRTIDRVFPHVSEYPVLAAALAPRYIQVESLMTFWVSEDTGKLQRVREHMDWSAAIEALVSHPDDLAFVLEHALISADGVLLRPNPQR